MEGDQPATARDPAVERPALTYLYDADLVRMLPDLYPAVTIEKEGRHDVLKLTPLDKLDEPASLVVRPPSLEELFLEHYDEVPA